jgi:hypothetical protein
MLAPFYSRLAHNWLPSYSPVLSGVRSVLTAPRMSLSSLPRLSDTSSGSPGAKVSYRPAIIVVSSTHHPTNTYQPQLVTQAQRHFKWIPWGFSITIIKSQLRRGLVYSRVVCCMVRYGRRGMLHVGRCISCHSPPPEELLQYPWRSTSTATMESEATEEKLAAEKDISWRICNRWLLDADDEPAVEFDGPDTKDRAFVNKFHPKVCFSPSYS